MDLTELSRLTDEREILEGEIEEAERTISNLRRKNLMNLVADTQAAVVVKKGKVLEIDEMLRALNKVSGHKVSREAVAEPPHGKFLSIPAAYAYMDANPEGKAIVAEEFWEQVKKGANEIGCWNVLFKVDRTRKGTLKKQAYIHWFRKKLGAVKLAWYLCGHGVNDDENLRNECGNTLCVHPSHHYQGATGKIKKKRDHQADPVNNKASISEVDEYTSAVFMLLSDKWDKNVGIPFKEIIAKLVPKECPDENSLRVAMCTPKAKNWFHLVEGRWFLTGHPEGKPVDNAPTLEGARAAMERARGGGAIS